MRQKRFLGRREYAYRVMKFSVFRKSQVKLRGFRSKKNWRVQGFGRREEGVVKEI